MGDKRSSFRQKLMPSRSNKQLSEGSSSSKQLSGAAPSSKQTSGSSHTTSQTINDDKYYMDEESMKGKYSEGESVEQHKSVIMHLLSQVKPGMDLTKVTLPTFILERRSLLEMYADMFAFPQLFLDIAKMPTPKERMIAAVRFYMSTFSAGRDSRIAKKPYNPIIGEFFQCLYDTETEPPVPLNTDKYKNAPVPWASENQVAFLGEQISHHPPVSAVYAEHRKLRIMYNGHVWTKSKFYGVSIGVENIGPGVITLLDRGELYELNYPSASCRSILTVPWIELVGDCEIRCAKTNLRATIKFQSKPFYRGKANRISGEILEINAKKPFCTIEGEWDEQLTINHMSAETAPRKRTFRKQTAAIDKTSVFFDKALMTRSPKRVRRIDMQEQMESRRLWRDVTEQLQHSHLDAATEHKQKLEAKQRDDARVRDETGVVYQPRFFHLDGNQNWRYKHELPQRT